MLTKFRPPDLAAQNGRIDEIRMIPNVVKHPNRNSPPKLGGVAARSIKSREATLFRADGVVLGLGTTPSRLMKRRRATPPNLGGEFLFGCFALVHPEFPQIRSSDLIPRRRGGRSQAIVHSIKGGFAASSWCHGTTIVLSTSGGRNTELQVWTVRGRFSICVRSTRQRA